jgi:hypothetical protein
MSNSTNRPWARRVARQAARAEQQAVREVQRRLGERERSQRPG